MAGLAGVEWFWGLLADKLPEKQLTTIGTFVLHELFYWFSYLPFYVLDTVPAARKWKIQDDKENEPISQWECAKMVLINHFALVLPMILLTHLTPIFQLRATLPLPPMGEITWQVFFCFVAEDFLFYWGHRALHTNFLYRHIHHVHHRYAAPFGIAAEYAHPVEVVFLGVATIFGPMVVRPHLLTLWVYLLMRCFQTIECHSGYDFPWSINRWLPLYGGADFHDHHHRTYSGNYASTFVWLDKLYGTDQSYREWKKNSRMREKTKGM